MHSMRRNRRHIRNKSYHELVLYLGAGSEIRFDRGTVIQKEHRSSPSPAASENDGLLFVLRYMRHTLMTWYPNGDVKVSLTASRYQGINAVLRRINDHMPKTSQHQTEIWTLNRKRMVMFYDPECERSRLLRNPKLRPSAGYVKLFEFQEDMIFNVAWSRQLYMARRLHGMLCEPTPSFTQSIYKVHTGRTHAADYCSTLEVRTPVPRIPVR